MGKILIIIGLVVLIAGLIINYFGSIPFLGKLPGDITIKGDNYQVYFPIATSIILSIILSILFYLFSGK